MPSLFLLVGAGTAAAQERPPDPPGSSSGATAGASDSGAAANSHAESSPISTGATTDREVGPRLAEPQPDGLDTLSRTFAGLPFSLQIHGFVSQGFIKSTRNNYLVRSRRGSFEFSEVALSISASPIDDLSISMQLFSRDLGPIGNYQPKMDWYQLDWRPWDELGVRVGRVRMPLGLYNDSSDYDPGRVSVLLPQSLYPTTSRDFLLAVTGGMTYGVVALPGAGYLDYGAYGGTLFVDVSESALPTEVEVPYVVGGRLLWEPVQGLRAGGSVLGLRLDGSLGGATFGLPAILWVASAEYQSGRLLLSAEYGRWHTRLRSSDQTILTNADTVSERYHLSTAVEVFTWLRVGAYYSGYFKDVAARRGIGAFQHDLAATFRFDVTSFWLIKVEGHYMHGTAVLTDALNRQPPASRPKNWGYFLLKTTAYF